MAIDVFISYSGNDKATALETCSALEAAGLRCWIAPRDVRPGVWYAGEIMEAIDSCRVMVLIFSSSANASPSVQREIERAASKGVQIVPMRIEPIMPTQSMEYFLGSIQWFDAIEPPLSRYLPGLVEVIKGHPPNNVSTAQTRATATAPKAPSESFSWKVRPQIAILVAAIVLISLAPTMWENFAHVIAYFHPSPGPAKVDRAYSSLPNVCQGAGSLWDYEKSIVYLQAIPSDRARVFYYCQGAQAGRILFSGQRITNRYDGTAYVYSNKCGSFSYEVTGQVLNSDDTVVISGPQPQIDELTCKVSGIHDARLEFNLRN